MTMDEIGKWVAEYRRCFLGPGENFDFISTWQKELLKLDYKDAVEAISSVSKDMREAARFPIQHLHLIVEYAEFHASERIRSNRPKVTWGPNPTPSELWDKRMLQIGAIDQAEFDRRAEERRAASSVYASNSF